MQHACMKRQSGRSGRFVAVCLLAAVLSLAVAAQQRTGTGRAETKKIEIVHADKTEFAARVDSNAWRLKGHVQFFHEGVTMNCDSAWWYRSSNTMDAFGNIVISKPEGLDQVVVTGDFLRYSGDRREAEIWDNVVMTDKEMEMRTDHVYYDMAADVAYYLTGADIRNGETTLSSVRGRFYRPSRRFFFKQNVEMHSPDYDIYTDTLLYNVALSLAEFAGPTDIASPGRDSIYCEDGWYNTNDTIAFFHKEARMKSGSNTIYADTLFFDKVAGIGEAFHNVRMIDTINNLTIKGHYGYYDSGAGYTYVTDSTLMIMGSENDSLYLHGDTLYTYVNAEDVRTVLVYNGVKFFSRELQGKCDSLSYSTADSVIRLYYDPVVWGQQNQLTAETIELETAGNEARQINLVRGAVIASPEDSLGFNQLKGRNITGYFKPGNYLYKVMAKEDAEAVFFAKDGTEYIGMNMAKSNDIRIMLTADRKFDEIMFIGSPSGRLYPIEKLPGKEAMSLPGFVWRADERPRRRDDIYHTYQAASGSAAVKARRKAMMVDGMISFEDEAMQDGEDGQGGMQDPE
ncbi:MAG: hypothetical protein K6F98_03760 [Bacteroidales bacterium]|nr:hypothetical protein [Bacteroidales bacterium]